ncbi:unnamed protein product [Symbiodinium sp. CCMP2592]|nr:unnamed protein product [Symbiodinium sp. CCMP2592]
MSAQAQPTAQLNGTDGPQSSGLNGGYGATGSVAPRAEGTQAAQEPLSSMEESRLLDAPASSTSRPPASLEATAMQGQVEATMPPTISDLGGRPGAGIAAAGEETAATYEFFTPRSRGVGNMGQSNWMGVMEGLPRWVSRTTFRSEVPAEISAFTTSATQHSAIELSHGGLLSNLALVDDQVMAGYWVIHERLLQVSGTNKEVIPESLHQWNQPQAALCLLVPSILLSPEVFCDHYLEVLDNAQRAETPMLETIARGMQQLQQLQAQALTKGSTSGPAESLKAGTTSLAQLPDHKGGAEASLRFSDWLEITTTAMTDVSEKSGQWWGAVLMVVRAAYSRWLAASHGRHGRAVSGPVEPDECESLYNASGINATGDQGRHGGAAVDSEGSSDVVSAVHLVPTGRFGGETGSAEEAAVSAGVSRRRQRGDGFSRGQELAEVAEPVPDDGNESTGPTGHEQGATGPNREVDQLVGRCIVPDKHAEVDQQVGRTTNAGTSSGIPKTPTGGAGGDRGVSASYTIPEHGGGCESNGRIFAYGIAEKTKGPGEVLCKADWM